MNECELPVFLGIKKLEVHNENLVHNVVVDSPTPDFKAVKRILKRANSEEIFDGLNDIFNLYTKSLDSKQCWKMIAELERVLTYS